MNTKPATDPSSNNLPILSRRAAPLAGLKRGPRSLSSVQSYSERCYPSPPMSNASSPSGQSRQLPTAFSTEAESASSTTSDVPMLAAVAAPPATASHFYTSTISAAGEHSLQASGAAPVHSQHATTPNRHEATARGVRKSKAHVASACVNCKRAHLSCDVNRPCARCIASGKQDSCFDVQHRKRGRPRLREEGDFKVEHFAREPLLPHIVQPVGPSSSMRPIAATRPRRTEEIRSTLSQAGEAMDVIGRSFPLPRPPSVMSRDSSILPYGRPLPRTQFSYEVPTAYLNLDLVIIRGNGPFYQIVSGGQDICGRRLEDFVAAADGETFASIRARLRAERETREPLYMPPIVGVGQDQLAGAELSEVDRFTQGFNDHTYRWSLQHVSRPPEQFPANVRLAKGDAYFVAVTLPSFRPVEMAQSASLHTPINTQTGHSGHLRVSSVESPSTPRQSSLHSGATTLNSPSPVMSSLPSLRLRPSPGQQSARSYAPPQLLIPHQFQSHPQPYGYPVPRPFATEPRTNTGVFTPVPLPHDLARSSAVRSVVQLPPLRARSPRTGQPASVHGVGSTYIRSTNAMGSREASGDESGTPTPRKRRKLDLDDVLH